MLVQASFQHLLKFSDESGDRKTMQTNEERNFENPEQFKLFCVL